MHAQETPGPEEETRESKFVDRSGEVADADQLAGEPSLTTEVEVVAVEEEPCDLDCIEAELAKAEAKERQSKGVLEVAQEGELLAETDADVGDSLAAEPSATSLEDAGITSLGVGELPTRLGPVRITVGKGNDWIGFGLATQLEFDYEQQFPGGGADKESIEKLQFRRIRLILSSSFVDGRIRSRLQMNLTPSQLELLDMWLAFTRFKFATMRIGQFKIPFDRYRAQSFAVLSFVDWAPTTRVFGSERQMGIEALAKGGFLNLEYAFGVFTGTNARGSHGIGAIEFYGEVAQNPSELGDGELITEFHPEIVGRTARNFGEINTDTNSDVTQTRQLRHSLGFGFAYDARADPIEDLTLRLSLEWLAKIRGFDFNVVTYLAWFPPFEGGRIDFGPFGVMGEAGYRFTVMWELAIRYSLTYLTPALRRDTRAYGEFQIANATDTEAAIAQYGLNGDQKTNAELALAATAHIIGNSLKTVLQTAWENQRWVQGPRNGLRIELQLQFLF
ncbi:MAG: hypothetical protein AAF436_14975 [Myxococcota bacterium]